MNMMNLGCLSWHGAGGDKRLSDGRVVETCYLNFDRKHMRADQKRKCRKGARSGKIPGTTWKTYRWADTGRVESRVMNGRRISRSGQIPREAYREASKRLGFKVDGSDMVGLSF